MNLITAISITIVFSVGVYLALTRNLLRVYIGVMMVSYSVILFIVAAGFTFGAAPILPLEARLPISDPLVQALALTAVVISFGTSGLVFALLKRVYVTQGSLDRKTLDEAEFEEKEKLSTTKDELCS